MKKALSILTAVLLMVSVFSFVSVSAETKNLLPVTEENFVDNGCGAWIPSVAAADMLGQSGGIFRSGNDVEGITLDTENVKYGKYSFKFERGESENSEVNFPLAIGYLTPGKTYTFQAYVKTNKVLSAASGAFVGYCSKAVVPEYRMVDEGLCSEPVIGTKDWTLISVTFTAPADPDAIVILNCGVYGTVSGTAWFDGIALVEGGEPVKEYETLVRASGGTDTPAEPTPAPTDAPVDDKDRTGKNLIVMDEESATTIHKDAGSWLYIPSSPHFKYQTPCMGSWIDSPNEREIGFPSEYINFDTETVKFGSKSIMLKIPSKTERHIRAFVALPGDNFEAGKTYTVQGYVKTNKILGDIGASVSVEVKNQDHVTLEANVVTDIVLTGTKDWTLVSSTFTMPESDEELLVTVNCNIWNCMSGTAWFDGLAVVEGDKPVDYTSLAPLEAPSAEPTPAPVAPTLNGEPSAWAKEEILKALEADLVPEHVNSNYTTDITRSDFCDLIIKMIEKKSGKAIADVIAGYADAKSDVSFPDTDSANVIAAAKLGIVNGRSSGAFDPTANITRQEAAKMLALAAKVLGADITASEVAFADADDIYAWAKEFIYYVNTIGVMNGTSTTTPPNFSPLRTYTREQSILTVYRLFNAI
ncbi:MAG: hypothetical protein E7491_07050 [Ruminococcaceae bacterium]|nr:hypothetical protein [Oscillospiraceae bacterium]